VAESIFHISLWLMIRHILLMLWYNLCKMLATVARRLATHRLSLFCWPVILVIIFGLNFFVFFHYYIVPVCVSKIDSCYDYWLHI